MSIQLIPVSEIDPHPDNPRLILREDVIQTISAQLVAAGFDEAHALLVRPYKGRYQILDGHHRVESAKRAKLLEVPAWVREYSDEDAHMQLALANAQSGLTPLERGRHAQDATTKYGKDGTTSVAKYAERLGRPARSIHNEVWAFEVYQESATGGTLSGYFRQLIEIHSAPRTEWPKLAAGLAKNNWTVEETKTEVKKVQPKKAEPELPAVVPLADWKKASLKKRAELLDWRHRPYTRTFNKQEGDSIDWAKWSWNPVTGCQHNCPYCYARDISAHYKQSFEPALHLDRLVAPFQAPFPAMLPDTSYRNVFTGSMADLFGQWVPSEWIEEILAVIRENSRWNFLLLTKFPIRMAEFEYPDNAWLGTTVDLQARVKNAERAMAKVKASVKWLSLEPLLEPLRFENLKTFQWVVIGGASRSTQTPEFRPPRRWVNDLTAQAQDAGCAVYHKTNLLLDRLTDFPGSVAAAETKAPELFQYLKAVS